jgi:hypothetical protein
VVCGVLSTPPLAFLLTGLLGGLLVTLTGETSIGTGFFQCGVWGVMFSFFGLWLALLVSLLWRAIHPTNSGGG